VGGGLDVIRRGKVGFARTEIDEIDSLLPQPIRFGNDLERR
jgi:hypothetical protein